MRNFPSGNQEHKRQAGGSAGQQVQTMVPGEDREYDYRRFLQRYAVWGEELEPGYGTALIIFLIIIAGAIMTDC